MRLILFITLPATVGLILLRREIIEVLFEGGAFDQQSAELTAWALMFFAVGLSAFSMIKIVVQAFYAIHDTWTPVVIGFFSLLLNIACNFLFFRWLRNGGPALATSLAAFFDTFVLMLVFRYRHGTLGLREVIRSATKFVVASLVMGAVVYMFMDIPGVYTGDWVSERSVSRSPSFLRRVCTLGWCDCWVPGSFRKCGEYTDRSPCDEKCRRAASNDGEERI